MPNQIEVPKRADVTFKVATKHVIHHFEVAGTNTNMMIKPGYASNCGMHGGCPLNLESSTKKDFY
jgi:heme/copper-type cytochrome/quinol oxidase subunit 2